MSQLYPLKFNPIIMDKIWGGSKLRKSLNKPTSSDKAGESWEISGVPGNLSIVSNGFLEGNGLDELIEVYMGDLMGDRIYDEFGNTFPLLIKFIDANDVLSIQVHPDDAMASERHNSFGKTEMWYVIQADKNAELIVGFNKPVTKELYLEKLNSGKLSEILNYEPVSAGDVFYLPAGRIHAIGAGILLAEIQQTSDITYRIYDFERKDDKGNYRELHTEEALDAIDFTHYENYKTEYENLANRICPVISSNYFTTNKMKINKLVEKDISQLDCFVIYMCLSGSCQILYADNQSIKFNAGETVLIPAMLSEYSLSPFGESELLEVYINDNKN